jgi:nucleotide-binding universal stress UspA family protein
MRVLIGVDWSDQAFSAVTQTLQLFRPTDIILVHGVDLGVFESPLVAGAVNMQGYDDFRNSMLEAGFRLLERTSIMIPPDVSSVKQINEIGSPAEIILNHAEMAATDLMVVGARGRSRLSEVVLGSVSHRVLAHASRPTLVVRGAARAIQRVLVGIQGHEDAGRITHWLTERRFATPVELCVCNVVVPVGLDNPYDPLGTRAWWDAAERRAEDFVKSTAAKLLESGYTVSTKVAVGNPADMLTEHARKADLVVVASHGRTGISRFLMGSVSHAVVHRTTCPVLVLR